MTKGILINYEFCTGCHSCEVACKKELGLDFGEFGIKLEQVGPYKYQTGDLSEKWEWTYLPVLTKACTMCEDRVKTGKMPACVQHCQAWCMYFGDVEDLARKIDGSSRCALMTGAVTS
ncbi:MAG: hypothetical protein LBG97_04435 [Coriobacteriales bacterium]|nr:hypothetical protein [Coriobacteriales bacterium]